VQGPAAAGFLVCDAQAALMDGRAKIDNNQAPHGWANKKNNQKNAARTT